MHLSVDRLAALRDSGACLYSHIPPLLRTKGRVEAETAMCTMAGRLRGKVETTDHQATQTRGRDEGSESRGIAMCQRDSGRAGTLVPAHPLLQLYVWLIEG